MSDLQRRNAEIMKAIQAGHDEMMAWPKEKLRAYLEEQEREIREGWLGISDWMIERGKQP